MATATSVSAITPSVASPAPHASSITLTATATGADTTHPAGTIQFKDGATNVGSAVAVNASGVATSAAFVPADGAHSFTAVFTPTSSSYTGSTSASLSYSVSPGGCHRDVGLGDHAVGGLPGAARLVDHPRRRPPPRPTPRTLPARIQFKDGATNVGSAIAVDANGVPPPRRRSCPPTVRTPSPRCSRPTSSSFAGSTSAALSYTVSAAPGSPTRRRPSASSPSTTGDISSAVVLTATVADSPNTKPTGTVVFKDGATVLGAAVTLDTTGASSTAVFTVPANTLGLGSHSFTAEYTPASAAAYNASMSTAVAYSVTISTLPAPQNVKPATIGAARVGVADTCNTGVWVFAWNYSYAWYLDASATPFSTSATTGLLPASYVGHKVKCVVTASSPGNAPVTSTSAQATVAAGAASVAKTKAKITGTPKVGKVLTAYKGVWSPAPTSYQYVWKRGSTIVGRSATYKATKADKGKTLVLYVYAVRTGYLTGVSVSAGVKIS